MTQANWLFAFLTAFMTAVTAVSADEPPLAHLSFQRSLQSGVRDANGKLITGTEMDFLAPHQGRLYAANCLWLETDPAVPKACQIFVLDSPKGQWRVERQFATGSLRCSVLQEITFATDGRGQAIAPVTLLLTAPDVRSGPVEVFCRDDATGEWSASVLGTATRATNTRSLGLHRDKVTGIDRIFAGNRPLGVMSGVYDPAAPGRIRWDKSAEVEAPAGERVHGLLRLQRNPLLCHLAPHLSAHRRRGAGVERCLFLRERNPPCRHSRPDGRAQLRAERARCSGSSPFGRSAGWTRPPVSRKPSNWTCPCS